MRTFLVFMSVCLVGLCGFSQNADRVGPPIAILSYSVAKLPPRPRLVAFSTPDVTNPRPASTQQRQLPSDVYPTLRQSQEIGRRSSELNSLERDAKSSYAGASEEYQYKLKARNDDWRIVERVFWQYETVDQSNGAASAARQFLCGSRVRPSTTKEFIAVTPFAPSNVVDAAGAGTNIYDNRNGRAVVNRIEFADGTIWENPKWDSARIKFRLNDEVYRSAKGRCVVL